MRTPTKPKLKTVTRLHFKWSLASSIWRRQVRWILFSTLASFAVVTVCPTLRLDLVILFGLWIGMLTAGSWRMRVAIPTLGAALFLTEAMSPMALTQWIPFPNWSHFTQTPMQTTTGVQLMASATALGLGHSWNVSTHETNWMRRLQTGLMFSLCVALGWFLCQWMWPRTIQAPIVYWVSVISTIASFSLWFSLFESVVTTRIPGQRTIQRELAEPYRPTCIQALHFDEVIAEECEDQECRDGLGEVAAWVYRLQWTLQRFDRELQSNTETDLHVRLKRAQTFAKEATDSYTKERHQATAVQLRRLHEYREKIAIERERALALVGFAMVNLEEARAQLVLARLQPGTHPPPSVQDVLQRLRNWSQDRTAANSSQQELLQLA